MSPSRPPGRGWAAELLGVGKKVDIEEGSCGGFGDVVVEVVE